MIRIENMRENKEKSKKVVKWAVIGFVFCIIGIVFLFLFNSAVPRSGYCGLRGVDLRTWVLWITNLAIFVLAVFFGWKALANAKKSTHRITSDVLGAISLVAPILLTILAIYYLAPFISACGARNIAIKANLSVLRGSGNLYVEDNNGSYKGFCDSKDVSTVAGAVEEISSKLFCNDASGKWVACAQLIYEDKDDYFCADSTGRAKTIPGKCDENWNYTSCP